MMQLLRGLKSLDELSLAQQRVLIRLDADDARSRQAARLSLARSLPTINHALSAGARVILAAHRGEPGAHPGAALSLESIGQELAALVGQELFMPDECVGDAARKVVADLRPGQLCLLENLRFSPEEQANDEGFARRLAALCDVYVADALAPLGNADASVVTLPRLVKERGIGAQLKSELEAHARLLEAPERPDVVILGGSRFAPAASLLESMLARAKVICAGGAAASTFLAAQGVDLKETRIDREQLALARALLTRARDGAVELVLPEDLVVAETPGAEPRVVGRSQVPAGHAVYDVGPRTLELFASRTQGATALFWSGPLGAWESPEFRKSSLHLATELGADTSLLGGPESLPLCDVLEPETLAKGRAFFSLGGIASLDLVLGKRLLGLEALRE
jgi:phosphoglycerate kinase